MRSTVKSAVIALASVLTLTACGGADSNSSSSPLARQQAQVQSRSQKAAAASYQQVVEELYIAYFGRPADPAGLVNFENALAAANAPTDIGGLANAYNTNPAVATLVNDFSSSAESKALYSSSNNAAFVAAVFNNVLGRAPQQAGLDFWANAISSNGLNRADAALAIMAGGLTNATAQGVLDTQLIDNRVAVASYFTVQVSVAGVGNSYSGAAAAQAARTMLAAVLASTDTTAYQAKVNSTINALPLPADAGIIKTVAGKGDGDNGAAAYASVYGPSAVAVDAGGNIYIAEGTKNRIRKVAAATGIITTVAGTGAVGYTGDNGPATAATLYSPQSVKVDRLGNIIIADTYNNVIREVSSSDGTIRTIAGTGMHGYSGDGSSATNADFRYPLAVAVDANLNIYVADSLNHCIRQISSQPGHVITTVVGNGTAGYSGDNGLATQAELHTPSDVALDAKGDLYIADGVNNAIRKVNIGTSAQSPVITTIAGNGGGAGFSGDNGPATSALLNDPVGVAIDASGNLYISEILNNRLRKVSAASGIITTLAGNGTAGFSGDNALATQAQLNYPGRIAVDANGNVYVADGNNNRVRKINGVTDIITTFAGDGTTGFSGDAGAATGAELQNPQGVAFDAAGNMYIADSFNNRIRKVSAASGIITTFAGTGTIGYSGDQGLAVNATLSMPQGLAVDGAGNLYIVDAGNNVIRKVAASTGVITTVAGSGAAGYAGDNGPATSAEINVPQAIAVDSIGNIYIADANSYRIRKVTAATGIISTVAGNGNLQGASQDNQPAINASLAQPFGVAVDNSGNLYITDTLENRIRRVDAVTGLITTVAGNSSAGYAGDKGPAINAEFNYPFAIAVDGKDNLFIADRNNFVVRKVDAATGLISTVAGNGSTGFSGDNGVATNAALSLIPAVCVDNAGNLYIADSGNDRIRAVADVAAPAPISQ